MEVCLLLAGLEPLVPRPKKIWADGAYGGKELAKLTGSEITLSSRSRLALSIPVPARLP